MPVMMTDASQGLKAGQVSDTIWQRVSVEKLVKRRLGDRADWGEQVGVMVLIQDR